MAKNSKQLKRLRTLFEFSLELSGEPREIFSKAVRAIAELLDVRVVILSEIRGDYLHFLSIYADGKVSTDAVQFPLKATPCATVVSDKDLKIYDRVAEIFPDAEFLHTYEANSYCGFPSIDKQENVIAVTCLLDNKPHDFSENDQYFLKLIGQRLADELERQHLLDEKKHTEHKIISSEASLAEAQHIAMLGSWELDMLTNTLHWSDEIYRIFEINPEEFDASYEAFMTIVHPDDRLYVDESFQAALNKDKPYNIEHRLLMADGRIKFVQELAQITFNPDGQPLQAIGTVQDITRIKLAEQALQASNNELELKIKERTQHLQQEINERQRQQQLVERAAEEERVLTKLMRLLLEPDDMQGYLMKMLEELADKAFWLEPLTEGALFLTEQQGNQNVLQLVASYNLDENRMRRECTSVQFGDCICGKAVDQGCTLLSRATSRDDEQIFACTKENTLCSIPIMAGTETLGLLLLQLRPDHEVSDNEVGFLNRIADILSTTISRKQAEEKLRQRTKELDHNVIMLNTISDAQTKFISENQSQAGFNQLLSGLLEHTQSKYGLLAEVHHKKDGTLYLKTHSTINHAGNDLNPGVFDVVDGEDGEFHSLDSLLGAAITSGKPVIANDPANDPRRGGLPDGHIPLHSYLGMPIIHGEETVGMLGIANRPGGYDEKTVNKIRPFISTAGHFFKALYLKRETRAALLARQEKESHLQAVVENIGEGLVSIDHKGIIRSLNPGAEKMFGYSASEVVDNNVSVLIPEHERAAHEQYTNESELTERRIISRTRDLEGQRKDGSRFPMELHVEPMSDSKNHGFVGLMRDITDRKKAEKKILAAKQEAERANHIKSEFLARMSHELRTPLNAILGFSELLQMDSEDLNTDQSEFVERIQVAGKHLLNLINEVLDLSRLETGHIEVSLEPVSCNKLLKECKDLLQPLASKRDIELKLQPLKNLMVMADYTRAKEVIINLLSNAVKYNRHQGLVQITCKPAGTDRIRISITDTGPGLTEEQQSKLFQPFQRLGAEYSDTEGTGIGLVIVKRLVELMGGSVGLDSVPGQGSTFWVELEKTKENHDGDETNQDGVSVDTTGNKKDLILYIEDNPASLRLVEYMIKRADYSFLSSMNPTQGLELARKHSPSLILLDIDLPEMNGFEILKHLREDETTCPIPVIAVSAHAMSNHIGKVTQAGFDDYLTKPVTSELLLSVIDNQLNR